MIWGDRDVSLVDPLLGASRAFTHGYLVPCGSNLMGIDKLLTGARPCVVRRVRRFGLCCLVKDMVITVQTESAQALDD